jgi:uncharacterized surface protein with fasciclin (FAS1) repeats
MTSLQGTFEFFNNEFCQPNRVFDVQPLIETYAEQSVMWYINKFHPKYAYLIKRARLDQIMSDPQFNGTVFVPLEKSINESELLNMDINTARKIVKYQFMAGLFPKNVLMTSKYQQLQSTIKGSYIWAEIVQDQMFLNFTTPILFFDINMKNGIIHVINNLLFFNGTHHE